MDLKLKKEIGRYSGIAGTLFATGVTNAQVVYVDVVPDIPISFSNYWQTPYNLDIDQDNVIDFQIMMERLFYSGPGGSTGSSSGGSSGGSPGQFVIDGVSLRSGSNLANEIVCHSQYANCLSYLLLTQPLIHNTKISSTTPGWRSNYGGAVRLYSGCTEGWALGLDFYAGLKFKSNNFWHYAWIRMQATSSSVIIKDYAYELMQDTTIVAGRTASVGIENYFSSFEIKQDRNRITINNHESMKECNITVTNMLGQEFYKKIFTGNELDFSLNNTGIYFIELISENKRFIKKIFVY